MQLREFEVQGLFGRYHHKVPFPVSTPAEPKPSLVIIHGPNGVGKTTILRMIDGLMRLDFNIFRESPFERATLRFEGGSSVEVKAATKDNKLDHLAVTNAGQTVKLHPARSGALEDADAPKIELFRANFFSARESLAFEFIDTSRMIRQRQPEEDDLERMRMIEVMMATQRERHLVNPKALAPVERLNISDRIARFIGEAQVNHRRFFASAESDLFERILHKLGQLQESTFEVKPLLDRLSKIAIEDKRLKKMGIEVDDWKLSKIKKAVSAAAQGPAKEQAVIALGAFVEMLESRTSQRILLADRIDTFLRVMEDFFHDKTLSVSAKTGLSISTKTESPRALKEGQLSTGEFHLLYLMVAALVTQRRGTVIAIDEPEMSMHLAWQRKLIKALFECASKAEPLFIFATHSPDVAADFPDALLEVGK